MNSLDICFIFGVKNTNVLAIVLLKLHDCIQSFDHNTSVEQIDIKP